MYLKIRVEVAEGFKKSNPSALFSRGQARTSPRTGKRKPGTDFFVGGVGKTKGGVESGQRGPRGRQKGGQAVCWHCRNAKRMVTRGRQKGDKLHFGMAEG